MIPEYHLEYLSKFNSTLNNLLSSKSKIVAQQARKCQAEIEATLKEKYLAMTQTQELKEGIEQALLSQEPKISEFDGNKEFDVNAPSEVLQDFLKKYKKRLTLAPTSKVQQVKYNANKPIDKKRTSELPKLQKKDTKKERMKSPIVE